MMAERVGKIFVYFLFAEIFQEKKRISEEFRDTLPED